MQFQMHHVWLKTARLLIFGDILDRAETRVMQSVTNVSGNMTNVDSNLQHRKKS